MLPAPFRLFFVAVPLTVAGFALVLAAFPRRLTRWRVRGPEGTRQVEPSRTRILLMRVAGVVVAGFALLMAFATVAFLP